MLYQRYNQTRTKKSVAPQLPEEEEEDLINLLTGSFFLFNSK